jgi:two-component system sensor histidine kinase QseC
MRSHTLTRSLFLRIAPTILIIILMVAGLAFRSATSQINHVYDAQLISSANMIWLVVEDEMYGEAERFRRIRKIDLSNQKALNEFAGAYVDSRMFRVWKGTRLAMLSDGAIDGEVPKQKVGFSTVLNRGIKWRVYSWRVPATNISVEAAEKMSLRESLVYNILLTLAVPLVLLIPIIGLLIWFGIGSGLGTIRALIGQIRSRSPDDLSPINLSNMPRDLTPLGHSINQLLQKLEHSFNTEKRFAEHAAHHLRTPLATIKLQLQLMEQARNASERGALLNDLSASVERASRLVGQLLISTRVSHQTIARVPVMLKPSIIAMIEEFAPLAAQRNLTLSYDGDEDLCIMADETLLRLMIGNVIENAVKYTPENGFVNIALSQTDGMAEVIVTDSGPGIPEEERGLVFERFYRVGTPEAQGTGLGLAIVAEIISRLSGSIVLVTPPSGHGLRVEMRLPLAPKAAA